MVVLMDAAIDILPIQPVIVVLHAAYLINRKKLQQQQKLLLYVSMSFPQSLATPAAKYMEPVYVAFQVATL